MLLLVLPRRLLSRLQNLLLGGRPVVARLHGLLPQLRVGHPQAEERQQQEARDAYAKPDAQT